ncbi:MAG: lysophospholipid acyltransferase family protein [Planctomycetaceae bacterium]|nr:lysophospholipid acyltransferase family protein [Planctomycetaceae bacterium]
MNWLGIRHWLEYAVFRVLVCIVQAMTWRQSVAFARGLANLFTYYLPRKWTRYDVAADNLRHAFPEEMTEQKIEQTIHQMWLHLFRMVAEIVQAPRKMRLENCYEYMTFPQSAWAVRTACSGRPVILMGGHFGNWEIGNYSFGMFDFPMAAVARDLDNPYLHDWFARFRRGTGHALISKMGGSTEMTQYMEKKGILGLLGDQAAGRKGIQVDFFGRPVSTMKSIALLAMQFDAVLMVAYTRRLEDDFLNSHWSRFEVGMTDLIDPRDYEGTDAIEQITQRYTTAIESAIRKSPEQYFWLHRRWKQPVPRKRKKSKSAPAPDSTIPNAA